MQRVIIAIVRWAVLLRWALSYWNRRDEFRNLWAYHKRSLDMADWKPTGEQEYAQALAMATIPAWMRYEDAARICMDAGMALGSIGVTTHAGAESVRKHSARHDREPNICPKTGLDLKRARAFVYHPEKGAKMVYLEDADKYLRDGWYDSPARYENARRQQQAAMAAQSGLLGSSVGQLQQQGLASAHYAQEDSLSRLQRQALIGRPQRPQYL